MSSVLEPTEAANLAGPNLVVGTLGSGALSAGESSSAKTVSPGVFSSRTGGSLSSVGFAPELWSRCLTRLKAEVNAHLFSAYVKPLKLSVVDLERREFIVSAPSQFVRNHVEGNFSDILLCVLRQESQNLLQASLDSMLSAGGISSPDRASKASAEVVEVQSFGVKFLVDALLNDSQNNVRHSPIVIKKTRSASTSQPHQGNSKTFGQTPGHSNLTGSSYRAPAFDNPRAFHGSQAHSGAQGAHVPSAGAPSFGAVSVHERRIQSGLNPKYTFSNFVVGNNNQFCNAASLRVAEEPGKSYNPLFIYGGVGLGKTHLMHAIGNAVLDRDPNAHVVYQSSETFTNELIQALRNAKMDEFKRRMRSVDLLLIDDIQFMSGKERTQEEFFHTFNTLYNAKHQIVITSDKIPQEISGLEERLQTRFAWGLTADLQAPDFETRVAILRRKAALDGFALPENVAQLIAEKISSNVRELEGALTRVHAITSLQNIPLTLEVANSALRPLLQPKQTIISVEDIKRAVAQHFSLKVSEIISKRRTKNLSFPRHIAMYLCRKHTTCSYPEIGSHFGNRDHSSVIHAAGVVSTKVGNDTSVRELVAEIERRLLGR